MAQYNISIIYFSQILMKKKFAIKRKMIEWMKKRKNQNKERNKMREWFFFSSSSSSSFFYLIEFNTIQFNSWLHTLTEWKKSKNPRNQKKKKEFQLANTHWFHMHTSIVHKYFLCYEKFWSLSWSRWCLFSFFDDDDDEKWPYKKGKKIGHSSLMLRVSFKSSSLSFFYPSSLWNRCMNIKYLIHEQTNESRRFVFGNGENCDSRNIRISIFCTFFFCWFHQTIHSKTLLHINTNKRQFIIQKNCHQAATSLFLVMEFFTFFLTFFHDDRE